MKGENEAYVGEKRGFPKGTVGKGGALIEPCSECSGCLGGSLRRNWSGELGQTCEAGRNGIKQKALILPKTDVYNKVYPYFYNIFSFNFKKILFL